MSADTAALLEATIEFVRRYVVLTDSQLCAIALWTLHTHTFDAADTTPYLAVTSAEKASGKTRLLEVLELVVANPWLTGRVTPAVLARKVHAEHPTLLLDESDAAFAGEREYAETLRGVLNTGHRRGGCCSVCIGQGASIRYADLGTFCPKAIAGIGELPDTVASRSIRIVLKRKAPDEEAERFRRRVAIEAAEPLHQWAGDWGSRLVDQLGDARPELPNELGDRAADSWEPLFAIADLAEGGWPETARGASLELSEEADLRASAGARLLGDCRTAFNGFDRLSTKDLLTVLVADEEAPWGGWHRGSPISPRALANLLEPYGIRPRTIRLSSDETARGYARDSFEDPWRRYLGSHLGDSSDTPSQAASEQDFAALPIRNENLPVADEQRLSNPHQNGDVSDVVDRTTLWAES